MFMKAHHAFLLMFFPLTLSSQSGSLDSSFNGDGTDEWDFGANSLEIAYSSLLQPDGTFLIAGWSTLNIQPDYAVIRYTASGERDTTFGVNGFVLKDYIGTADRCQALTTQPDGKILLVGSTDINAKSDFSVLRLNTDGSPDSTFGQNGWVITDMGTEYEFANTVAVQPDGKIILAGRVAEGFFSDFAMVRYTPDGKIDSLFGNNGMVITNLKEEDAVNDIIIQPDGKIILAGFSSVSAKGDFALVRYNPDGTPDKFFGDGGKSLTDLEGANDSDFINEVVLLQDGRILAAGNANNNNLEFTSDAGMVMYMPDGSLDETFGTNGIVIKSFGSKTNIEGLAVQPDGKILLCGTSDLVFGQNQWLVTRFFSDGSIDTTFGSYGIVTTPMGGNNTFPNGIYVQPDTRILVGGSAGISPNFNFAAARYIADFQLSSTVSELSCYNANDGSITIHAEGGIAPYIFSIDGGGSIQAENTFSNLGPGSYFITIRDSNNNGATATMGPIEIRNLPNPPAVVVEANADSDMIFIHVEGSPEGVQFSIDGGLTFSADSIFADLEDGLYLVVVVDGSGCIIHEEEVLISTLSVFGVAPELPLMVAPNPTQGTLKIKMETTTNALERVSIFDMTGRLLLIPPMAVLDDHQVQVDVHMLQTGSYVIHASGSGHTYTGRFVIMQ